MSEVMERVISMMMGKMVSRMSAEDVRSMMQEMMGQIFGGMEPEERATFMGSMMQVCIPKLTDGLEPQGRERISREFLGLLGQVAKAEG